MAPLKVLAAVLLLSSAALAQLGGGGGAGGHASEQQGYAAYYHNPKYNYEYAVNDEKTGDKKRHSETRDGDKTHGEYSFTEPDGTVRTVKYQVQGKSGFVATVSHSGHSKHPSKYTQHFDIPAEPAHQEPQNLGHHEPQQQYVPAQASQAPAAAHPGSTQAIYGAPQQQGQDSYKYEDQKEGGLALSGPALANLFANYYAQGGQGGGFDGTDGKGQVAQGGYAGSQGGLEGYEKGLSQGNIAAQSGLYQGHLSAGHAPGQQGGYEVAEGGFSAGHNQQAAPALSQGTYAGYAGGQQGGQAQVSAGAYNPLSGGIQNTYDNYGRGQGGYELSLGSLGGAQGGLGNANFGAYDGLKGGFAGLDDLSSYDFSKGFEGFGGAVQNGKGASAFTLDEVKGGLGGYEGFGKGLNGFQPILSSKGRGQDLYQSGLEGYSKDASAFESLQNSYSGSQGGFGKGEADTAYHSVVAPPKSKPVVRTVRYLVPATKGPLVLRPIKIIRS
ncbi:spidroin-1-like [Neocloeon triangulifer]|uniref:spidroin-1-like n=1 Tax=Neocloeon triangulifer TaxID=2078957 RepID=UPI00286F1649|nr:spidroin-1-like [Neocloeon triangulifer]